MQNLFWITIFIIIVTVLIFVIIPRMTKQTVQLRVVMPSTDKDKPLQKKTEDHLAQYYEPANACVPENNRRRAVGDCPPSRAFSSALPITNIPLCMALKSDNMNLVSTSTPPMAISV